MSFKVGDTVVYPHHGAARIEAVETRTIKGEDRTYLVLKVDKGDLTVRVPADNAELVGVRDVVGADGLERVFEVLRAPHTEEPTNWSRRYKANLEKLASGDVNKVAEVVRDATSRYLRMTRKSCPSTSSSWRTRQPCREMNLSPSIKTTWDSATRRPTSISGLF